MLENYQKQLKDLDFKILDLNKKDNKLSFFRLLSFLSFLAGLVWAVSSSLLMIQILPFVLLFVFIMVLARHQKTRRSIEDTRIYKELLENEINALQLKDNQYYNGMVFRDPDHDFSQDMDLFGKNSLFQYINRCATGVGVQTLANILRSNHSAESILERQEMIRELAQEKDWCMDMRRMLYKKRMSDFSKEFLPEIKNTLQPPSRYRYAIFISYMVLIISVMSAPFLAPGWWMLLVPVVFNMILLSRTGKFIKTIKMQLEGRERTINEYRKFLSVFEKKQWHSVSLKKLQKNLSVDGVSSSDIIAKLYQHSRESEYTLNMLAAAFLNYLFAWDLLVTIRIAGWFNKYAGKTQEWFGVIGQVESLLSLANIDNNHDWVYPEIAQEGFLLHATEMGHPLIPVNERVTNSFTMQKPATIAIITGSNMAGKSTFLRTTGINIILAHAGAPVCASRFHLSIFRIMTYLTITDSLSENTSTFYREIKRMKKILDSSKQDSNVLLLLDELLRGTNSADKARGSIAITSELVENKIPAVIATHNLELADMQKQYEEQIRNYYFDITIENNEEMRFDYKLKQGICNTFNASILLKEIGINIDV